MPLSKTEGMRTMPRMVLFTSEQVWLEPILKLKPKPDLTTLSEWFRTLIGWAWIEMVVKKHARFATVSLSTLLWLVWVPYFTGLGYKSMICIHRWLVPESDAPRWTPINIRSSGGIFLRFWSLFPPLVTCFSIGVLDIIAIVSIWDVRRVRNVNWLIDLLIYWMIVFVIVGFIVCSLWCRVISLSSGLLPSLASARTMSFWSPLIPGLLSSK